MKIVHIIYSFPTGGAETMLVDIINEQAKYESISLIILNNFYNQNLISKISKRITVYLLNRKVGSKNLLPILRLNYILTKIHPTIIHCHDYSLAILIAPFFSAKKVSTIHDMNISTKFHSKYDQLYAISEAVQNDIKKRSNLESKVVYNGIRVKDILFKKENNSSIFRIIQVSRLDHKKKGQHILLEAISILVQKFNVHDLHLDFIGEGESMKHLVKVAEELHITKYVSFLGLRDREYIYAHLKDYSLLVQPSLFEGFGLTVVEALAAGIEVVVSDIDGPLEILEKIGFGHKFNTGDAVDCANNLFEIYSKSSMEEDKSQSELQRSACERLFNIKITAKNYLEEYRKLLSF